MIKLFNNISFYCTYTNDYVFLWCQINKVLTF
nr:MAG TPA: hypothetical protein [Caudoviricetes sp.]